LIPFEEKPFGCVLDWLFTVPREKLQALSCMAEGFDGHRQLSQAERFDPIAGSVMHSAA